MGRTPCCDRNGLKKGPWTPEEDQKLMDYIQKHGYGNWRTLPKNAGLQRCGKSCRLRWTNYLRPDIKRGRFSFEEEETIIQLHSILGNKWSAIAARLPGRTDNEIKNYWNTHIRKRLLRMGIDPITHNPRLDLLDLSSIFNHLSNNSSNLFMMNNHHQFNNNMSRLLMLGQVPFVNPEILKLATSLLPTTTTTSAAAVTTTTTTNQLFLDQSSSNQQQHQLISQLPVVDIPLTTTNTCSIPPSSSCSPETLIAPDQFYPSTANNFDYQQQQQQQQQLIMSSADWEAAMNDHLISTTAAAAAPTSSSDLEVISTDQESYYLPNNNTINSYDYINNNNHHHLEFYNDVDLFGTTTGGGAFIPSSSSSSPTPLNSNSRGGGSSTVTTEDIERESYSSVLNFDQILQHVNQHFMS